MKQAFLIGCLASYIATGCKWAAHIGISIASYIIQAKMLWFLHARDIRWAFCFPLWFLYWFWQFKVSSCCRWLLQAGHPRSQCVKSCTSPLLYSLRTYPNLFLHFLPSAFLHLNIYTSTRQKVTHSSGVTCAKSGPWAESQFHMDWQTSNL